MSVVLRVALSPLSGQALQARGHGVALGLASRGVRLEGRTRAGARRAAKEIARVEAALFADRGRTPSRRRRPGRPPAPPPPAGTPTVGC